MKHLPIGMQTFSKLIQGNCLYVDKTKDIYNLLTGTLSGASEYFFLSRPRRFGKSLLVTTLKEIFSGNKELFKDLWIYDKLEWQTYPVIHLDFLNASFDTPEALKDSLKRFVHDRARENGIKLDKESDYKQSFVRLIEQLSVQGKVVILIDEYDKPIIDFIDNQEIAVQNRDILKSFYSTLKGMEEYLQFIFITGVSKFSRVSIFSDLNNLKDITLNPKFATMLGYTQEELETYFADRLDRLAGDDDKNEWLADIKSWYNGYSWDGRNFVYNPFSILNLFHDGQFANYWFETGSPSFLVQLIRKYNVNVTELENFKAGEEIFSSFEIDGMHVASLLFQTGYLTIKEIIPAGRAKRFYVLSYPNLEVKEAFLVYLLGDYSPTMAERISVVVYDLKTSLESDDLDRFFELLRSLFAAIPYEIVVKDKEAYYQTVIYLVLILLGINIKTEVNTNLGRLDAVIETASHIYVMEFKMTKAAQALNQIKEKKYYERYLASHKKITLVGAAFDRRQRNLGKYKVEILKA